MSSQMIATFALFDDQGLPRGFYREDIQGPLMSPVYGDPDETGVRPIVDTVRNTRIPEGVIEITEEQWREFLNNQGHRKWTGTDVAVYVPPGPDLAVLKEELKAGIDAAAEAARLKYITPGSGQALEYQAVTEEARALQADQNPSPANYPNLQASVGIDIDPATGLASTDIHGSARSVLAMQGAWAAVGAAIRQTRLTVKAAIDAAGDVASARAIAAGVVWP